MNVQTQITSRLKSVIYYSLDNDLLENAEFTAERLLAITGNSDLDSLYIYGLVLYKQHNWKSAYRSMANQLHVGCAYVFAQCALRLQLYNEGIYALQQTRHLWHKKGLDCEESSDYEQTSSQLQPQAQQSDQDSPTEWETYRTKLPDTAAILCLLGKLYHKIGDTKESAVCHAQALKLNPYIWESFEQLCSMGADVNVKSIYKQKSSVNAVLHQYKNSSRLTPMNPKAFFAKSGFKSSTDDSGVSETSIDKGNGNNSNTNGNNNGNTNGNNGNNNSTGQNANSGATTNAFTNTGSNAASHLDTSVHAHNSIFSTPRLKQSSLPDAPLRVPRRQESGNDVTDSIRKISRLNASKMTSRLITTPTNNNSGGGSSGSNHRSSSGTAGAAGTSSGFLKRGKNSNYFFNSSNSLDLRKKEYYDQAEYQLMTLYTIFARGLKAMARYDCYKAIRIFSQLPENQIETPWVLAKLGRLNFEIVNYEQAEYYFSKLRKRDRTRTKDMEYYSTLLWHLHKDIDLSYLAHEMYEVNRTCPETWVAIGNQFSLLKDTDEAIKCFQRAVQLDESFAYAHTLQGHEYVANDAYENALESFRNALLYDSRHYNALYGIGMVYLKLGEFTKAEYHFRKARDINPVNVILICCVGMVLEKMDKKELALKEYELACELQPLSPLAMFKKAQILFSMKQIQASLVEFEKLKVLAPDEASVHFLLGQLYKYTNRKNEAIKEFTIAQNLDPKGSQLIKDALESLSEEY